MDDQTLAKTLTIVLTRIQTIQANSEDAANIAFATRAALSATLKELNPELQVKFQGWIEQFQPHVSRHSVDDELQEILRQLAPLLPR